ncbi:glycoside hydrolase family 43 protein [Hymenobacter sp. BT186]|uniref:Glycoside hydrolase family 43 protein n=2 Tax=Hymenobacter telluris TaxID=2816474 RepID=A0A939EUA9_9BACT|nr:glycoside hydrolase family 43 protein [Hymenobacter telluris]MBW3373986.1 glycoside hydrolase family 43 protein [Hymenobacter norwichensis]
MLYFRLLSTIMLLLASVAGMAQKPLKKNEVLLFAYFKNNGQDGLHLATSPDGYQWTALNNDQSFLQPTVSNDKLMRDPCIIRGKDGLFHMVWTTSWHERGIGYASSKDLVNWSVQQNIPVMEPEPTAKNCWAPEITYDARHDQYMIYWATTIPGRFAQGETTLEGGNNHRIYYTTTKDFKTFAPSQVLYDQGFNVIDATVQPVGKRFVMFLKDETKEPVQKNLRVAFADQLTGPYGPPSAPITGKYWAEGPTAIQLGKEWLVYFDKYTEHKYGAVSSTDLEHWTDVSDRVQFPKGTRHGTVLRITKKELAQLQAKKATAAK